MCRVPSSARAEAALGSLFLRLKRQSQSNIETMVAVQEPRRGQLQSPGVVFKPVTNRRHRPFARIHKYLKFIVSRAVTSDWLVAYMQS
jgi:hypothetical protein